MDIYTVIDTNPILWPLLNKNDQRFWGILMDSDAQDDDMDLFEKTTIVCFIEEKKHYMGRILNLKPKQKKKD